MTLDNKKNSPSPQTAGLSMTAAESRLTAVPYDRHLLERAITQWQFGDWESLLMLDRDMLEHHPDRARLALFVGAARLQNGRLEDGRQFFKLAREWGCSKKQIAQMLAACVHDHMANANLLIDRGDRAVMHLEKALNTATPGCETRLLTQGRLAQRISQLGKTGLQLSAEAVVQRVSEAKSEVPVLSLEAQVERCLAADDPHAAIDDFMASGRLSDLEKMEAYFMISDAFFKKGDRVTALHFLRTPLEIGLPLDDKKRAELISKLVAQGRADLASDIAIDDMLQKQAIGGLGAKEQQAVKSAYMKTIEQREKRIEHGHDLLLDYVKKNVGEYKKSLGERKPVLIEIGTTRENVPGQGSTRKIAEFCHRNGLEFITVDMDPHNTRMAKEMFDRLGFKCQAVTAKGEDYLRAYQGNFDFIFLDAYDFDHGGHSQLRQSRYEKFLGAPIDDTACHQMHLDCAQSVKVKLADGGIVCVDDTWLENGAWTAKGTLAMPYLIDQGFVVLEARNRAALLARHKP